jgi:hypothetical protein
MAFEQKEGQGALFTLPEEKRRVNGPTLTGSCLIGGKRYSLAAWKKEGRNGRPNWLSLAIKPWEERIEAPHRKPPQSEDDPW